MGWCHGFKLHLLCNELGDVLTFCLTSANVDDRDLRVWSKVLYGKVMPLWDKIMPTWFIHAIVPYITSKKVGNWNYSKPILIPNCRICTMAIHK